MTLAARLEALAVDFARDLALAFVRAPLSELAPPPGEGSQETPVKLRGGA